MTSGHRRRAMIAGGVESMSRAPFIVAKSTAACADESLDFPSVPCIRELEIDPAKVNPHGGAIARVHPLGCSGARITTTLLHEKKRRGLKYGLATMCVGADQVVATLFVGT